MARSAVIVDNSHYNRSVQCGGNDLGNVFTDKAYVFAQTGWASEKEFWLATFTNGGGLSNE